MTQAIEQPTDSHMKDYEAHVRALEADIEYWRAKRLDPRILHFARRNILPLYALLETAARAGRVAGSVAPPRDGHEDEHDHDHEDEHEHPPLMERIRALEDRLDEFVKGMAIAGPDEGVVDFVIDDSRKESGAYDPFFKLTKRTHGGTMEERLDQLDREFDQNMLVLETFTRAMVEYGLVSEETLAQRRAAQAKSGGEMNGARIVARAWVDPDFKRRLIENGREAVRELDIPPGRLAKLGVAENTTDVHNVVVCTLCSCYPNEMLGSPPWWYRHDSYKQQIVLDPRTLLVEMFDLQLPESVKVRVHDSTADLRWMVLPERPPGTEGWSEEQLAQLVTKESLVGVGKVLQPDQVGS